MSAAIPVALAVDTLSITVMETVDNAVMLLVPGDGRRPRVPRGHH